MIPYLCTRRSPLWAAGLYSVNVLTMPLFRPSCTGTASSVALSISSADVIDHCKQLLIDGHGPRIVPLVARERLCIFDIVPESRLTRPGTTVEIIVQLQSAVTACPSCHRNVNVYQNFGALAPMGAVALRSGWASGSLSCTYLLPAMQSFCLKAGQHITTSRRKRGFPSHILQRLADQLRSPYSLVPTHDRTLLVPPSDQFALVRPLWYPGCAA
ncbi:hypothetical protein BD309DRAFT_623022 [Dichomitus squalens]|nr:hypothetical protein BD309DRAFT_623022 [Dichomitus squalens]